MEPQAARSKPCTIYEAVSTTVMPDAMREMIGARIAEIDAWRASGLTYSAYAASRGLSARRIPNLYRSVRRLLAQCTRPGGPSVRLMNRATGKVRTSTYVPRKKRRPLIALQDVVIAAGGVENYPLVSRVVGYLAWRDYLEIKDPAVRSWFFITQKEPDPQAVVGVLAKFGIAPEEYLRHHAYAEKNYRLKEIRQRAAETPAAETDAVVSTLSSVDSE